jgi:hypothetical protein
VFHVPNLTFYSINAFARAILSFDASAHLHQNLFPLFVPPKIT